MDREGLAINGSTGSIGTQTLKIVEHLGNFEIIALVGRSNVELLAEQARKFNVAFAGTTEPVFANELRQRLKGTRTKVVEGERECIEICNDDRVKTVVNSAVGVAGLIPTLSFLEHGKRVALANKESLVVGGDLVMDTARKNNATLLLIDSEHSALAQCLRGEQMSQVEKVFITASGGPFRDSTISLLRDVTPEQALKHPTWKMGKRITIDSATLMNKGFEVIEAKVFFGIDPAKIEVVIHPKSIVHAMVQFKDGGIKAQIGEPDMGLPIQYALTYPERAENQNLPRLDVTKYSLTFERPDIEKFPCLGLAFEAMKIGGTATAVLNGADERAVSLFLEEKIKYTDIPRLIGDALMDYKHTKQPSLSEIMRADKWARSHVEGLAPGMKRGGNHRQKSTVNANRCF